MNVFLSDVWDCLYLDYPFPLSFPVMNYDPLYHPCDTNSVRAQIRSLCHDLDISPKLETSSHTCRWSVVSRTVLKLVSEPLPLQVHVYFVGHFYTSEPGNL